jgi:hypothetical protein
VKENDMMKWLENHPRRDTILVSTIVVGALFNIGWVLMFPDNGFAWLNWFAGGFCAGTAACLPTMNKLRRLVDDQHGSIVASNAAMEAISPEHMRTMLQGALVAVVEQMKREGTLGAEINVTFGDEPPSKSFH